MLLPFVLTLQWLVPSYVPIASCKGDLGILLAEYAHLKLTLMEEKGFQEIASNCF